MGLAARSAKPARTGLRRRTVLQAAGVAAFAMQGLGTQQTRRPRQRLI